eukprot:359013-Chlamydomonas_euryale.AAC.3
MLWKNQGAYTATWIERHVANRPHTYLTHTDGAYTAAGTSALAGPATTSAAASKHSSPAASMSSRYTRPSASKSISAVNSAASLGEVPGCTSSRRAKICRSCRECGAKRVVAEH